MVVGDLEGCVAFKMGKIFQYLLLFFCKKQLTAEIAVLSLVLDSSQFVHIENID